MRSGPAPGVDAQLEELQFSVDFHSEPDPDTLTLIGAADQARTRLAGAIPPEFVQTDGRVAAAILLAARQRLPLAGDRFGEWGSGLGLVSCIASRLGYRATGIEIDPNLVSGARDLAADLQCDVAFIVGSYKPEGFFEKRVEERTMARHCADLALFDFDLIYAYAWPSESDALLSLFAAHARPETVLLLYRGGIQISAWRRNHRVPR